MKSNLFRTLKLAALAFCGAAAFACTNLDDIEQRLDSLESDIQKLQTAVTVQSATPLFFPLKTATGK